MTPPNGSSTDTNGTSRGDSEMAAISERYRRLYGGLIYDVLEHFGYPHQVISHEIQPLAPDMKLAAPAFTVKGTTTCERDESRRYRRLSMIKEMTHPCIEVRDAGTPFPVALYGELSATTARAHGAVGALVDGGVRDSAHMVRMDYPVFCRYRNPVEAFGRWVMLEYQVPVLVHGETVHALQVNPGDFIFGDLDGVIVIPKDIIATVLNECERVMGIEDVAREEFARGEDPVAVFQKHKRL